VVGEGWHREVSPYPDQSAVETIAKIRRAYFAQNKPIKTICREFRVSRRAVRKVNPVAGDRVSL
jgi:hypothetical protein